MITEAYPELCRAGALALTVMQPEPFVGKGISRHVDQFARARQVIRPVDRDTGDIRFARRLQQPGKAAFFAPQRTSDEPVVVVEGQLLTALGHVDGQHRMRAHLQESAHAVPVCVVHRLGETNGGTQVPAPVIGIEFFRTHHVAVHGRVELDRGTGERSDVTQCRTEIRSDRVDVGGMRGIVDRDAPGFDSLRLAIGQQFVERPDGPRHHGHRWAVHRRDVQRPFPTAQPVAHLIGRQRHRCHPAETGQRGDGATAQHRDPGGGAQWQRTDDVRRRNLALGVPDDRIRHDPQRAPRRGERNQHRE